MSTKSRWNNQLLEFYDGYERVLPVAPVVFRDDFLGYQLNDYVVAEQTGGAWLQKITGAAPPTVDLVANAANGVVACTFTNADQKQEAGLYWGDQLPFAIANGLVFEAYASLKVLPTGNSETWIGVGGAYTEGTIVTDGPAWHAFFVADGSGAIVIYTDDTSNDNDAVATGVTLVAEEWAWFRIDFSTPTDVKFYINGVRVASGTTFNLNNTTTKTVQPYLWVHKESGTGIGTLYCDVVRMWSKRA